MLDDPSNRRLAEKIFCLTLTPSFCIFLGDLLISWKCKKQQVVSRSSAKSKYQSFANVTSEIIWLIALLKDFTIKHSQPYSFYCDKAALYIAANPCFPRENKTYLSRLSFY